MKKRMKTVLSGRARADAESAPVSSGEWPLARGFSIGPLAIDNRVVQAPLAGIANWAFRRQSRRHGAGFAVSEMVASMGIVHGNAKTREMLRVAPDEGRVGIQVFGDDPQVMAEAARAAEEAGAALVDINMGCPVPKIMKTGAGASLLDRPDRAAEVVAAMVRAVDVPVTVKMRRGTRADASRPGEVAKRLADAGASAVFFHPRAAVERYEGRADHRHTAELVRVLDVPVIASGDITTSEEARRVRDDTGCAAVAIGRAALGNPWVFGAMARGEEPSRPTLAEVVGEILAFAEDARAALGDRRAGAYMRKFYPWYLARTGLSGAMKEALVTAPTLDDALALVRGLRAGNPEESAAA